MKLFQVVALSLFWQATSGQPLTYCGLEPCLIPLNSISCEELILNYEFLGSCCSLVDIPATGGCRIEVGGAGNCAWVPFCGPCDPTGDSGCGREYSTETTEPCPVLTYDALAIQRSWNQTANSTEDGASSVAPSSIFAEPVSCPPTSVPVPSTLAPEPTPSGGASLKLVASFGTVLAATVYATLL